MATKKKTSRSRKQATAIKTSSGETSSPPSFSETAKGFHKGAIVALSTIVLLLFIIAIRSYTMQSPSSQTDMAISDSARFPDAVKDMQSAEQGDFVSIKFAGRYENGTLFDTNYRGLAEQEGLSPFNIKQDTLNFTLGEHTVIEGLEEGIIGMKQGEKKSFAVLPEKAYGQVIENNVLQWPSKIDRNKKAVVGRVARLSKKEVLDSLEVIGPDGEKIDNKTVVQGQVIYAPDSNVDYIVRQVKGDDVNVFINVSVGDHIRLPGTTWNSTVITMNMTDIIVMQDPSLGDDSSTQWGVYNVTVFTEEGYTLTTQLIEGMRLDVNGKYGTIVNIDDQAVTFDANHPLAGKTLTFEVELVDLAKA